MTKQRAAGQPKVVDNSNPVTITAKPRSFFKAPLCTNIDELDADVGFIGMPFDQGTFGRPGARFGPDAIRDAPRAYSYADPYGDNINAEGYFDIDAGGQVLRNVTMADCGDITVLPSDVMSNFSRLTQVVEKVIDRGSLPVIVGGDHAITYPAVRGMSSFAPLDIVHFDAHMDYAHDYLGELYTHGSPIRRCRELPFVNRITSIGVRSARRKYYETALSDGNLIVTTNKFRELGPENVADLVPKSENLYITLDIDVLDPVQAPGTGTPEVGGLYYLELKECLVALVKKSNLVGFDLVEVAPSYDSSEITGQVAAQLIIDVLAAKFSAVV